MDNFEVVVIVGLIGIAYTVFGIGSTLHTQTTMLNDTLTEIKEYLIQEDPIGVTYNVNDIYRQISDLPEEIAKDILHGLSYYSEDMGLKYDLKDINKGLESIEKSIDAIDTRILHVLRQRKLDQ